MAALVFVGVSHAAAAQACSLGTDYQITSVSPYRRPVETGGYGGTVNPVLRGADIRVAARPGLTAEWLERQLEAQFAAGVCQLATGPVDVDVLSEGDAFIVRVTGIYDGPGVTRLSARNPDERAAQEILRRAQELR